MSLSPREQVAVANRVLVMEDLIAASGHVSVRDPDRDDRVYINPRAPIKEAITPDGVDVIDLENNPVDEDAPNPGDEAEIHTAIYRERSDVGAVLHLHPPVSNLFSISGTDIVPVHIRGSMLDGPVPVLDRPDKITDGADSERMLEAMGDGNQVLIRGHGSVVCDVDVKYALVRAISLERNARYQYRASQLGNPNQFTPDEVARVRAQNWKDSSIDRRWEFYTRKARKHGYLPESWD